MSTSKPPVHGKAVSAASSSVPKAPPKAPASPVDEDNEHEEEEDDDDDEDDDSDESEDEADPPSKPTTQRGGKDKGIEDLTKSMSALKFVPHSVRFGRGRGRAGFARQ